MVCSKTLQLHSVSVVLLCAALACNNAPGLSRAQTATPGVVVPGGSTETTAPEVTAMPTPLPAPVGWIAYVGDAPVVSFYYPPDWTAAALDDHHVEIRPATGFAWMEINLIDATHSGPTANTFGPDTDIDAFNQSLLVALREDGTYAEPVKLPTRGGSPAWVVTGHNDRFEDDVVVGVVGSGDHALLMIGHRGDAQEDWPTLQATYQQVIQSNGN
jgi:hypothetical protein